MGMEVMQAQFVEQRLFNNLMQIVRFEDFFSTFKPLSNSCARGIIQHVFRSQKLRRCAIR